MTGQVKEEVLTRFGELGAGISDGKAYFEPKILDKKEFFDKGDAKTLSFTWCATPVTYRLSSSPSITIRFSDGSTSECKGSELSEEETRLLFARNGKIEAITVNVCVE